MKVLSIVVCSRACVAHSQDITPITTGVVITHKEPVYEINTYAEIYVTISGSHTLDEKWIQMISSLESATRELIQEKASDPRTPLAQGMAAPLLARIAHMKTRIARTSRTKRGLFNFIGDIGSALFGTPSASDIQALQKANEQLAGAVEGVVNVQQRTIARVNQLARTQEKIISSVNDLVSSQNLQDAAIRQNYELILINSYIAKFNNRAIRIMSILDVIDAHLAAYEEALGQAQAVRTECEMRLITERTIPLSMVKEILSLGYNQKSLNLPSYYPYIQVTKIFQQDDEIICKLEAPLFSDADTHLFYFKTFEQCDRQYCLQVVQPEPFVLDFATENLYYPDECHGPIPQACRPGVIYDKTQKQCQHGLINHDASLQQSCPVTIGPAQTYPTEVSTSTINRYIVSTPTTLYHYRCPSLRPTTGQLIKGHYVIDIEPRCTLDAGAWQIRGIPTIKLNHTFEISPPEPIPLDWLQISNLTQIIPPLNLPKGPNKLQFQSYSDLIIPPDSNIKEQIQQTQSIIGKNPLPWWAWLLMTILVLTVLAVLFCYFRKRSTCPLRRYKLVQVPSVSYKAPKVTTIQQTEDEFTNPAITEDGEVHMTLTQDA